MTEPYSKPIWATKLANYFIIYDKKTFFDNG